MLIFFFFSNMSQAPSSIGSGSAASVNAGSLPVEPGDVDDKAPLWIYTN